MSLVILAVNINFSYLIFHVLVSRYPRSGHPC